jgi:hypothetical protein
MRTQLILAVAVYTLREELRRRLTSQMPVTTKSMDYRKRAAALAALADAEADPQGRVKLVTEALNWVLLAENDEIIAEAERNPEE